MLRRLLLRRLGLLRGRRLLHRRRLRNRHLRRGRPRRQRGHDDQRGEGQRRAKAGASGVHPRGFCLIGVPRASSPGRFTLTSIFSGGISVSGRE